MKYILENLCPFNTYIQEFWTIFVNMSNNVKKTIKDEEERHKREAKAKK